MSGQKTSSRAASDRNLQHSLVDERFSALTIDSPSGHLVETSTTESLGFTPAKTTVKYYSPDPSWTADEPDRISMMAALIRWPVTHPGFLSSNLGTWIYSCIDFAFPGLSKTVLDADPNMVSVSIIATSALVQSKTTGATKVDGYESDLPGLVIDPVCVSAEWLHAIGALTTLLFTLGKTATEENFTAFSVNRPKAIADKMGIDIDQASPMSATRLPSVMHYRWFGGYFNMHSQQRRKLVRMLLKWVGSKNNTADQTVVTTQVSLWRNAGLTHLFLVRDLLRNFGPAVIRINGLKTEIQIFMLSWDSFQKSKDTEKEFLRVIDGDKAQLGRSRDYTGLLNLARSLATVADPKFRNYAAGLGESPFKPEFIRHCKTEDFSLPDKYLAESAEGETGGGVVRTQ